mgnify:CR=1 FL=1
MADNEMKWEKTDENRYEIRGKEFQIETWLDTDGTFSWRISKGVLYTIASGDYVENVENLEADIYEALEDLEDDLASLRCFAEGIHKLEFNKEAT